MPMYGTRHFSIRIPQAFPMPGRNQAVYHDEIISGELGQIGTQFDGLGHLGIGDLFYNGNKRSEFAKAEGLTKLGVEHVGAITLHEHFLNNAPQEVQKFQFGLFLRRIRPASRRRPRVAIPQLSPPPLRHLQHPERRIAPLVIPVRPSPWLR